MSMFERILRGLAGPAVRSAPAADSMMLFRQLDELPRVNPSAAPSMGVHALGLPNSRMPDFGQHTFYYSPDILGRARLYGDDAYTPRTADIERRIATEYGNGTPEEGLAELFRNRPIRNGESPVHLDDDRIAAGLTPQFENLDAFTTGVRPRLISDGTDTERPFGDFWDTYNAMSRLHGRDPVKRDEIAWSIREPLRTGGRQEVTDRDLPDAADQTFQAILRNLDPNERAIFEPWALDQLRMPTRYAEAKYMDFLPPQAIQAVVTPDPRAFPINTLRAIVGRDVPIASEVLALDPAVLRRLAFGAGGVAPWMPSLGGGDE